MIWNDPPIMSMTAANIAKPTAQLLLCCSMFPPLAASSEVPVVMVPVRCKRSFFDGATLGASASFDASRR